MLRETNYKDSDRILTVLSKETGLLTLKARGVRKNTSKLKAGCQLLAYSQFTIKDYNGYDFITEADSVEMFGPIRNDIEKLSLACYFAETTEALSQEDSPNPAVLSVLLNSLYALAYLDYPILQVKCAFELKMACLAGYEPNVEFCGECRKDLPDYFNTDTGSVQCTGCAQKAAGLRVPINADALRIMRYIVSENEKRFLSFRCSPDLLSILNNVTETYLVRQLERNFASLDLYKSLMYMTGKEEKYD